MESEVRFPSISFLSTFPYSPLINVSMFPPLRPRVPRPVGLAAAGHTPFLLVTSCPSRPNIGRRAVSSAAHPRGSTFSKLDIEPTWPYLTRLKGSGVGMGHMAMWAGQLGLQLHLPTRLLLPIRRSCPAPPATPPSLTTFWIWPFPDRTFLYRLHTCETCETPTGT